MKSIGNILNYIENQKDKIKIEVKCNKEGNNYIIWIECKKLWKSVFKMKELLRKKKHIVNN